jgi:class 3 adenylate cyclase
MALTALATGTVTFLFTDVEGSTVPWEQHPEAMRVALDRLDSVLKQSIRQHKRFCFRDGATGWPPPWRGTDRRITRGARLRAPRVV